ncbi:type II toxin-antitoxin system RelE/ParE family toxin [Echinicola strongylocentroti]|uniref:Type II toxin-antitoxin system RelE/ParE family toxin n=1 Tax=Echinicola strongylocentroti TaxID=1795355 RepID=A0A2Z4IK89_9BACT|nr:type II toxin-antitoxin system RelE/ParE family toxin [Echinicola strongylocentroti]AWW31384.1 type II toxin-antitoxin system RelE/ParE family toxin [Echinicola strongylocentroti]
MAGRKVVWTKTADIQFVGVLNYWVNKNKSPNYSRKLVGSVAKRTRQIAKSPLIYRSTNFMNTRVAPFGNYSIFYKVTEAEIIITAFWDNRQDPEKLLKVLKKQQ